MFAAALVASLPFTSAALAVDDLPWPRVRTKGGNQVTVYPPQVDSWKEYKKLHARAAIAVKTPGAKAPAYGIVELDAVTVVDTGARIVAVVPSQRELRFPYASEAEAASLRRVVDDVVPMGQAITFSLDRAIAYVDAGSQATQRPVEVSLTPPKVFYSTKEAILVVLVGKPRFEPVEKGRTDLEFAINTNWDLFRDTSTGLYYLLYGDGWLASANLTKGPWTPTSRLPAGLATLPASENWSEVRARVPGKPAQAAPAVYVTTEPAELIVSEGNPAFAAISGTQLQRVTNSEATLFLHVGEAQFYYLVAGRWFRAKSLAGPWGVASNDLPADFARIPPSDPAAFVRASVPGTREAQDAVLLASIPTSTVVELKPVTARVVYSGEPQFAAVETTTVQYAVNTPESVFLVSGGYYWCYQGTWLTAPSAAGPWVYATVVPQAIYSIPVTHPTHNVTYVVVESSTPTTVVYNQTSGYSGEYVAANGVLMFGAGLLLGMAIADDDCDYCWYYPPRPAFYSYGCAATYHYGYGGYYASAHYYGPYGGAGRATAYNPYTGTYARGAYAYGPYGSASVRQAYNPYTGGYAHAANVNTAWGSAGRFYAEQGGKSVAGGYRSNAYGTAAGVRTSEGTGVAAVDRRYGGEAVAWDTKSGQGAAARTKSGDVYVGHDGNVYKKEQGGGWSGYEGSGNWGSVETPTPRARSASTQTQQQAQARQQQTGGQAQAKKGSISPESYQGLQSQAQSRQWGSQQSQRADQFKSSMPSKKSSGSSRSRPPRNR